MPQARRAVSKNNPLARGVRQSVPDCPACGAKGMVATKVVAANRSGMYWVCQSCGEMLSTN